MGGASIAFVSLDTIIVVVEDENGRLEGPVYPLFLTAFALSITSEGKLLSQYQPHTEKISDFLSPPFECQDDYTIEVRSPNEKFPTLRRRLRLEVDVGSEMDYILIGRDWQRWFDIIFKAEEMIISAQ